MERALGVAIGLGATYLFLSIVVLAVVEAIANLLSKRSKALRGCLEAVFEAGADGKAGSFLDQLLTSPLLSTLVKTSGAANKVPSHIPTPLFVTAFLSTLGTLRSKGEQAGAAYQAALAALPEKERAVVSGIVGETVESVEEAERRVGQWFDALMAQLSERYRRNTQWVTRIITALVVVSVNANALTMGATFWRDSVVREAAVQLAVRELALCELPGAPTMAAAPPPVAPTAAAAPTAASAPSPATPATVPTDCKKLLLETAENVPLPLGWTAQAWSAATASPGAIFTSLLGLLLSFVAVCLGAPFWFDILRRLTPLMRQPAASSAPASSEPPR